MESAEIRPEDAAAALQRVHSQQRQVLGVEPIPTWFWPALGALIVGITAANESRQPALIAIASVGFALGLSATVFQVVRAQKVQPRNELLGARGVLVIVAFTLALVAVGVGLAFALRQAGIAWPGTIGTAAVALLMIALGSTLGRRLQRIMSDAATRGV